MVHIKTYYVILGGRGNWTTDGCELTGIDDNVVTCQCNHLTNFAVLVVCKSTQSYLVLKDEILVVIR